MFIEKTMSSLLALFNNAWKKFIQLSKFKKLNFFCMSSSKELSGYKNVNRIDGSIFLLSYIVCWIQPHVYKRILFKCLREYQHWSLKKSLLWWKKESLKQWKCFYQMSISYPEYNSLCIIDGKNVKYIIIVHEKRSEKQIIIIMIINALSHMRDSNICIHEHARWMY